MKLVITKGQSLFTVMPAFISLSLKADATLKVLVQYL